MIVNASSNRFFFRLDAGGSRESRRRGTLYVSKPAPREM